MILSVLTWFWDIIRGNEETADLKYSPRSIAEVSKSLCGRNHASGKRSKPDDYNTEGVKCHQRPLPPFQKSIAKGPMQKQKSSREPRSQLSSSSSSLGSRRSIGRWCPGLLWWWCWVALGCRGGECPSFPLPLPPLPSGRVDSSSASRGSSRAIATTTTIATTTSVTSTNYWGNNRFKSEPKTAGLDNKGPEK